MGPIGVAAWKYKLFAFVVSAMYAGLAGALYAHFQGFINPEIFGVAQSLDAILAVILGGSGTIAGPVIGAFLVVFLPELLRFADSFRLILYGLILVLATIFMPIGIVGIGKGPDRSGSAARGLAMRDETSIRFLNDVRAFAREDVAKGRCRMGARIGGLSGDHDARGDDGLTRIEVPVEVGGLGLGFRAKAEACAIIAAADFGLAMSLVNTHNVAKRIATTAPPDVAAKLLPELLSGRVSACTALTEPGAGSDAAAMRCMARRTQAAGCWKARRRGSSMRGMGLSIVYAQCDQPGQASGIAAFLVDLTGPDCERHPIEAGFSQSSTGTGGFRLSGCLVPDDHLLLPAGTAFKAILEEINGARIYVAAMCCAMVSASLRRAQRYGEVRESFGKPLNQHPTWREPLAEAATRLAAAWALVETAIGAVEAGAEARHLAAAAKVNAVKLAQSELPRDASARHGRGRVAGERTLRAAHRCCTGRSADRWQHSDAP